MKSAAWIIGLSAVLVFNGPALAEDDHDHEHEGDVIAGVSGAGQLKVEGPFEEVGGHEHIHVLITPNIILGGYAGDEPGYDHLHDPEPAEDFYPLAGGAAISLEILGIDPGLVLVDPDTGSPVGGNVGDLIPLGDEELHTHLIFHAPGAAEGDEFELEVRLVDAGSTAYDPSDSFEFHVEAVPEPTVAVILSVGALWLRRRRR